MDGIGLVFAGGGGKGGYEIGVWKYLRECGLDRCITGVSGTSVGALNGALFAIGDYEKAENIWLNICQDQILTSRPITLDDLKLWIQTAINIGLGRKDKIVYFLKSASMGVFYAAVSKMLASQSLFSRAGLIMLMNQMDLSYIGRRNIPCYATSLNICTGKPERFDMRDYTPDGIKRILLSSSAIPVAFEPVKVQDGIYFDGGVPPFGDNIPIKPLYDYGLRTFLVVHLKQDKLIDYAQYPNARVIEIIPDQTLGGFYDGTLDFDAVHAAERIERGYQQAKLQLAPTMDILHGIKTMQMTWEDHKKIEAEYQEYKTCQQERNAEIEERMKHNGFQELLRRVDAERK